MNVGHRLDQRAFRKPGRRCGFLFEGFNIGAGDGSIRADRRQRLFRFLLFGVLIFFCGDAGPSRFEDKPSTRFPYRVIDGDNDLLGFVAHRGVELEAVLDCDHQVQIRFLRREALGLFTGRDNRVVGRDLLCIPDWTTKRGIGPGGDGFKSGDSGERGDDAGGILELLFGQIAAVGTRIRRQLLFIERLRGIQNLLCRHAKT